MRTEAERVALNHDLIERTRAAVTFTNADWRGAAHQEELKLEAFMGLFHPEKQADRRYMAELKAATEKSKEAQ